MLKKLSFCTFIFNICLMEETMIKLDTLLGYLKDKHQLNVTGDFDGNRLINRVDFLQKNILPDTTALYLCEDKKILKDKEIQKLIPSLSEPLMILSDCRETLSFPIIQADHVQDYRMLFSDINEKLKFEARLQQETNELYHQLYSGRGLDDLVQQAEIFLGRPISVLDASYSMIAVSPRMRQLPFGMETSDNTTFLGAQEVESLRRLQIEHRLYKNNQAFFTQTEDHPDTNWIFCAINIQRVMSGYVAVCLENKAVATEHELRLTTVSRIFAP